MKVESEEQGVRFEWGGEPDTVVKVCLLGARGRNQERLALLQEVIRSQRHGGIEWTDLEMRERHQTRGGAVDLAAPSLLLWSAQYEDWQAAGVAFATLCKAVGMDDDSVELDVKM